MNKLKKAWKDSDCEEKAVFIHWLMEYYPELLCGEMKHERKCQGFSIADLRKKVCNNIEQR